MNIRTTSVAIVIIYILAIVSLNAEDLAPEKKLIIACYQADLNEVVRLCREGANVNAQFGDLPDRNPFCDRWTGGVELGSGSWTPLIALAAASRYPDPTKEQVDIKKKIVQLPKICKSKYLATFSKGVNGI